MLQGFSGNITSVFIARSKQGTAGLKVSQPCNLHGSSSDAILTPGYGYQNWTAGLIRDTLIQGNSKAHGEVIKIRSRDLD